MILTAIKIGGVDYLTQTLLKDFSITDSSGDRLGTCTMTVWGRPTDLSASLIPGAIVEIQSGTVTGVGGAGALWGGVMFGETVFGNNAGGGSISTPVRVFYGRVISVAPVPITVGASNDGYTQYVLTCRNFGDLLNSAIVTTAVTYTSMTDKAIITDLLTAYLPEINVSGVSSTAVIPTITFDNITLREALENLVALSGAEFYVDTQKILQYHLPTTNAAPFGFSEAPDNVTTFESLTKPTYLADFSQGANRIVVLGAVGSGGVVIKSTGGSRNDLTSQATYGVLSKRVVDRTISTTAQADLVGDIQLAQFANPIQSGTLNTQKDGLSIGMYLAVSQPAISVSGTFIINKITMTWPSVDVTNYAVEWGAYQPDLARLLRKLATFPPQAPITPSTTPAPGSVGPGSFASTIQPIYIVNSLPALPDTNYPNDSFIVLTTDHKLYRNAGGSWTAKLAATDLGPDQILGTQISDNAITSPKIQALAITAGKIAASAVIAGTIAAGAIRASDAAFAAAAIGTADIADAAITNAKVASLSASKLTAGTIDASVITVTNLNASNITTGTLSGTRLADGSIADVKIAAGLSASKITTGTLSADRISGGTINVGSGGLEITGTGGFAVNGGSTFRSVVNVNAGMIGFNSNWILFTDGSSTFSSIKIFGTTVVDLSRNGFFTAIQSGGHVISDSGGNLYAQSQLSIGGNAVVGTRKADIGAPSFASLADVQTWCAALRTSVIRAHGLTA